MALKGCGLKSCPWRMRVRGGGAVSQMHLLLGPKSLSDTVGVTRKQSLSCLGVQSFRAREGLGSLLP